ncbi:MAG: DUF885 domain-containing protein, partial [Chloroflexi bacterium]|nr:DUF885 domain-containing protein [Chloroflexota bacterium]
MSTGDPQGMGGRRTPVSQRYGMRKADFKQALKIESICISTILLWKHDNPNRGDYNGCRNPDRIGGDMNTRSVLSAKSWLTAICLLASACTPQATPVESSPTPSPAPVILALQQQVEGASLGEFFEASFQAIVMRSPEEVLETGLTDFYGVTDARLDDISAEYRLETYSLLAAIQAMLETYDREVLPAEEQVSYDIYHWYLEDQLAGQGFMYHEYPATYLSVVSVPGDIMRFFGDLHPIDSLQDARDYVARLQQVGTKIDQLIGWLEASQQAGIQPPEFAIQWAIHGELGALVVTPPTGTVFYTSLESRLGLLAGVSLEEKEAVLAEAEKAITDIVLPAYQALVDFMEGMEVYPAADSGIWRLPQGESYYDYLLRHFTTTAMSAEEVHQLGFDELDRIHTAMRVIFDALGYPQDETLVQLFDRVAEDGGWVPGQEA